MSHLSQRLVKIQRQNYQRNMELVRENLGYSPAVARYEKEFEKYLRNFEEISNKTELIKRVSTSNLVYHGDYHSLNQSQRAIYRILREMPGRRKVIVCLEMFYSADQKVIDLFMAKKLKDGPFLKKIEYTKKWDYKWSNWKPIIDLCKKYKFPILGINTQLEKPENRLKERDEHSARIIAKAIIRNPECLIYVVNGDYHISPNHLPLRVDRLLKALDVPVKRTIVYQNAVNLYWQLCKLGREEADVLKINEDSYCVMNTMPANKIQSYLNWLEYSEDAYYPVNEDWEDEVFAGQGLTIENMVNQIVRIVGVDMNPDALSRLKIYYPSDLQFMDIVNGHPQLGPKKKLIENKIRNNEAFLLEYKSNSDNAYIIYLANSNLNMAAEEAAHFINVAMRGPMSRAVSPFDRFYRDVITECLGFFGSKFINEKRKTQTVSNLRKIVSQDNKDALPRDMQKSARVARLILQHLHLQKRTNKREDFEKKFDLFFHHDNTLTPMFSTQLGYLLGNNLYYAAKQGKFSLIRIRELFGTPLVNKNEAFEIYFELCGKISNIRLINQY